MKTLIALLLFTAPVFAQDQQSTALAAAGCGPNETQFSVKTAKKDHPMGQVEPGKALVYVFYQDWVALCIGGCIITRVGLDGAWVGANQGSSYFYFSVEPGDHRICMAWQSKLRKYSNIGGAISLRAEAGQIYYIRSRSPEEERGGHQIFVEPVDPAEGPILVANMAHSMFTQKKP